MPSLPKLDHGIALAKVIEQSYVRSNPEWFTACEPVLALGVILGDNATVARLRAISIWMNEYDVISVDDFTKSQYYNLPKSSIHRGLNSGPSRTHHGNIFSTLPLAHASIAVRLRFGLTSSCEDLSRLRNRLFHSRGSIPVRMAPGLTTIF